MIAGICGIQIYPVTPNTTRASKRHALLDRWAVGPQVLEAFGDHRERTNAEGICWNLTWVGKSFLASHYASRYEKTI